MDSANQQQPGWAKGGGGRGELFCFFPRPGSGGGREGGEDRDAGQQARCSNAQSGSDVLFQQMQCLEPGMKVPNGAPPPQPPAFLNNRALSLPGNNITSFVSYRQTHEKRDGGGSPCHIPGEVSCQGKLSLFPPPCPLSSQDFWFARREGMAQTQPTCHSLS